MKSHNKEDQHEIKWNEDEIWQQTDVHANNTKQKMFDNGMMCMQITLSRK